MTTVSSGHTSTSLTVTFGTTLTVLAGGSAVGTTVQSGGGEFVSAGGTDVGATIQAAASQTVSGPGATATSDTVQSFGTQTVVAGGESIATQLAGTEIVSSGGVASATAVGLTMFVSAGGSAIGTILASGLETVLGTDTGAHGSVGGQIVSGGRAFGANFTGSAGQTVTSGGVASGTTISSGGAQYLSAAGTAFGTTVGGGGIQTIAQGGSAVSTTLLASAYSFLNDGGTAISMIVSSGGNLDGNGGIASGTIIRAGGTLGTISGSALYTMVGSGGVDSTYGRGTDIGATVAAGGALNIGVGGIAVSATILAGGIQTLAGDAAQFYGAVASNTQLQGSLEQVGSFGTTFATTLSSGAGEVVGFLGTASGTVIQSGGVEVVQSGGHAYGTTVDAGGLLVVLAGGSAVSTTYEPGAASAGLVALLAPTGVLAFASVANGVAVGSNATMYVLSGGSAVGMQVAAHGTVDVQAGGTVIGGQASGYQAEIDLFGSAAGVAAAASANLVVESGGTASGTALGGEMIVSGGGVASNTMLSSDGKMIVYSGGSAAGATGGKVVVSGGAVYGASNTVGGQVEVQQGSAYNTTIGFLANMDIGSGAVVSNVTIDGNFAALSISAGATFEGALTIAPQTLVDIIVAGSAMPTTAISGFGGADSFDLTDISFDPNGSATYDPTSATLNVTEGGQTYALHLANPAAYAGGHFRIASDHNSGTTVEYINASSYVVSSGITSNNLNIVGNGVLQVLSGGTDVSATLTGAAAFVTYSASTVDGGTLLINSNTVALALENNQGTDSGTAIGVGGNMINAGTVVSASIASGGVMVTFSGTTQGVVVGPRGVDLVEAFTTGTSATNTVVNGGLEGIAGSAVAIGTTVNSGGEQVVGGRVDIFGANTPLASGTTSHTTVNAGGAQFVNSGAVAYGTQIDSGGVMVVNSAGTAVSATIGANGRMQTNAGATLSSGVTFAGQGAELQIGGTVMPTTTLTGFGPTDMIDLTGIAPGATPTASINAANDVLSIVAGSVTETLQLAGSYAGVVLSATSDGGGGTLVEIPCYAAGTRIATDRGEVAVESLAPGDLVRTQTGRLAPVRWVGRRRIDCRRHARPENVMPVRIAADAFGPGLPRRALLLSPDHAVFAGGVLIPVRYLVNGASVAPVDVPSIEYVHVELDRHDVMLAEGLPAESYLDTGNRAAFGGGVTDLHPDFSRSVWQAEGCAALVLGGERLADVRRALLARAPALGHRTTRDPGIAVEADGRRLPAAHRGTSWLARLPAGTAAVTLRSRIWTPAHRQPDSEDTRVLGVAIARLRLDGRAVALDSPALAAGWHAAEAAGRWTDGAAIIPVAGVREIGFDVAMAGQYWRAAQAPRAISARRG